MSIEKLIKIANESKYLWVSDFDGKLTICDKKVLVDFNEVKRLAGADREVSTPFVLRQRSIIYEKALRELRKALLN